MYQAKFSITEISKLIQIQNIFIQEIKEIESKFGESLYQLGDDDFINSRNQYRKRFDIYKYKIFSFVKIEDDTLMAQEILQWKRLICDNGKTTQIYFYDLKSLEAFVNNLVPGSTHSTSLRIKWSILDEFGYESGYEKIRMLYEVENIKNLKEDFHQFLKEYDLIGKYKLQVQEIINEENSSEKMTAFIYKIEHELEDKNKIEELLKSFVDFISFQNISEENIDILLEVIFDKLEKINYSL